MEEWKIGLPLSNFPQKNKGNAKNENTNNKFIEDIEKERERTTRFLAEKLWIKKEVQESRVRTETYFKIFYTTESLILAQDER